MCVSVHALSIYNGTIDIHQYLCHNAMLYKVIAIPLVHGESFQTFSHFIRFLVVKMYSVIKAVLMRIEAFCKVCFTSGAVMQKVGTYLENVSAKISTLLVGYLMRLILIYNENIVVVYLVQLSSNKEAFAARKAEKYLAAIVDMYIGVGITLLRVVNAKACVFAGVCNGKGATIKYAFH